MSADPAYKALLDDHTRLQAKHTLLERMVHLYGAPDAFDVVFEGLLDALMDYFPVEAASLYVIDADANELYIAGARGPKAEEVLALDRTIAPGEGIAGACFAENETLVVSEASADARFSQEIPDAIGYEVRSLLTAPLSHDGESLGVLQLLNRTDPGPFTPSEVDTLSQLGRLAGALVGLGWRLKALTDAHDEQA